MKVAIVYDRVNKWGGAERVLLSLHKLFPNAPLFTSVYEKKHAKWARVFRIHTSFLQRLPFIKTHHELFPFLMPFAFRSFSFEKYDLVISVTSEFAKGIKVTGKTKHICICLTPTRYLWSGYKEYFQDDLFKIFSLPLVWLLRAWDKKISQEPDLFVAISREVQKRIKTYYGRDSVVVYPPLTMFPKVKDNTLMMRDYFLVVSRLSRFTQYKHVDVAMKAAKLARASLVVVGDGDRKYLSSNKGSTIYFAGRVTEEELAQFYMHCKALIFPGKEDFGLAMVEAQSFGKPVIAYKAGGALEIVRPKKTGIFFERQNPDSLAKVLKRFSHTQYNKRACIVNAQRFSQKAFAKALKEVIRTKI